MHIYKTFQRLKLLKKQIIFSRKQGDLHLSDLKKPSKDINNLTQYTNGKNSFSLEEYHNEQIEIPTNQENLTILECDLKNRELLESIIKNSRGSGRAY